MSRKDRVKRLEQLITGGDAQDQSEATTFLAAWYAMKQERCESLRDEHYTPPTDEQRAIVAATPYGRIQHAFRQCIPVRAFLDYMAKWRNESTDEQANSGPSEGL